MRLVSTLTGVSLTGMMLALSTPASAAVDAKPVSYTHLTLPTIYSV